MKILHVIFSTNRIKYLTKTLESHKFLDYGNHEVTKMIIDDFPATRNDAIFELLCKTHRMLHWLHPENLGLSVTWSQFFDWVKDKDFDYILHQEDDVVLVEPVKVDDLIQILESDAKMASVVLQRQEWYYYEQPPKLEESDISWNNGQYFYSKNTKTFPIIFSLYRKNIVDFPLREYWGFNINEGMVMVYLDFFEKMYSATLKNSNGGNIINHIGEESIGRRVLEGEPNHELFAHIDPNKPYSSRNGDPINT